MRKLWLPILLAAGLVFGMASTASAKDANVPAAKPAAAKKKAAKKTETVRKAVKKPSPKAGPRAGKPAAKPVTKAAPSPVVAAPKPSTDVQQQLTKAGDYRFAIQHGGLERTYRVHVPQRYSPAEPAPLLVALHGGGIARAGDDGFESLTRESDQQGFIAVFPDGYAAKGKPASWNAGNCCGDARAQKVNDVGFIEQTVNNVFRQVSIDRERIYAAGVSDGGMMAYRLACDLPEVFRAVASVGGTDNTVACQPGRPVSVLHFHARNDPRVPVASAPATAAKWAEINRCEPVPRRVLEQSGAYCEAYTYCFRKTAVRLCVTDAGGHSWPGAKARPGAEPPSQALEATSTMLGFFSSH